MSEIERIKCGNGNAYIVSEGEHSILVDTCHEEYRDTPKGLSASSSAIAILLSATR